MFDSPQSIGNCCADDHCKFTSFLNMNPTHKCRLCNKKVHVACGRFVPGTDNLECRKCIESSRLSSSLTTKDLSNIQTQKISTSTTGTDKTHITEKQCPRCNSTIHVRSSSKNARISKTRTIKVFVQLRLQFLSTTIQENVQNVNGESYAQQNLKMPTLLFVGETNERGKYNPVIDISSPNVESPEKILKKKILAQITGNHNLYHQQLQS